jgi:hypothetical protein
MPKSLKDDLQALEKVDLKALSSLLGLKCSATQEFIRFALANALLFDRKMLDYGPDNIGKFGVVGCVIRASDKFERIAHLYKANRKKAANESLQDSFRDISNYMLIILMLENGKWA